MAISILQFPILNDASSSPRLHPVGNPINYIISSTNTGETNFRYVAKVYDENATELSTIKQFPDFNTNLGIFNIENILKSYVSSSPDFVNTGMTNNTITAKPYSLAFYEEYLFEWTFTDNFFYNNPSSDYNGNVGFTANTTHNFATGDTIYVNQSSGYTHSSYNGYHTIVAVPDAYSVVIEIVFAGNTPVEGGTIKDAYNRRSIVPSSSALTTTCYALDSSFSHVDWLDFSAITYTTAVNAFFTSNYGKFLTNVPQYYTVKPENHMELNIFSKAADSANTFYHSYTLFDENNGLIGTYKFPGLTTNVNRLNKVICGPGDLEGKLDATGAIISFSACATYWVYVANSANTAYSEIRVFTIDDTCSKYTNIELLFRDELGSYLPVNFSLLSIETLNTEKNTYRKSIGGYNGTNWTYNTYDKNTTVFNRSKIRSYVANTDWLNEDDANYLQELWSSNDVYAKIDGNWLPILITDVGFPIKNKQNTGLIQYPINFQIANNQ